MIFPSGFLIHQQNLNIELMQKYSKEWSLERQQIQKGLFNGSIVAVHTPYMQISFSKSSHGQSICGDFPKNTILLFLISTNGISNFQDKTMQYNELVLLHSGDEIDLIINSKNDIFTVAVEENLFRSSFEKFFLKSLDSSLKKKRLLIKNSQKEIFEYKLREWIEYFKSEFFETQKEKYYIKLENKILEDIFRTLLVDTKVDERVKFNVKSIRDKLHESLYDTKINISSISNDLNISERQLHHAFKSNYGVSPKQYLQILRLNEIRKELIASDKESITVADIALKYGFTHMSYFSKIYKDMFQELPSKTLN